VSVYIELFGFLAIMIVLWTIMQRSSIVHKAHKAHKAHQQPAGKNSIEGKTQYPLPMMAQPMLPA
jgi:hypothetical protein